MSAGPMFIREPVFGAVRAASDTLTTLISDVEEATLVEEIVLGTEDTETEAGQLVVIVTDDIADGAKRYVVGVFDVPASAAGEYLHSRHALNITLPVGWSMRARHYVEKAGSVFCSLTALGGIVR